MKSITNYFTINQFLTLQNFTWGGVETPYNSLYRKEIKKINDT